MEEFWVGGKGDGEGDRKRKRGSVEEGRKHREEEYGDRVGKSELSGRWGGGVGWRPRKVKCWWM